MRKNHLFHYGFLRLRVGHGWVPKNRVLAVVLQCSYGFCMGLYGVPTGFLRVLGVPTGFIRVPAFPHSPKAGRSPI